MTFNKSIAVAADLTPRERWGLLLIDELPDRPPVYPLVTSHAATTAGIDLLRYCCDGRALADAQLAAAAVYRHEGLSVFTDVGIIAEAAGSRYHLRDFDVPILDRPVVREPGDILRLKVPDPASSGRLPVYLEAVDRLFDAAGDTLPVFAFIPCPFTTAAGLRGVDDLLVDTITAPEPTHDLLEIALQGALRLADECTLAGALPVLVDPLASGSVISPHTFRDFALPYIRRLMDHLHRQDLDVTLHICGDTAPLLELIPATGADIFSFDNLPVPAARDALGDRIRLAGNIPPNGLLPGASLDVEAAAVEALTAGLPNPRGFILSTGCEVPIRADVERVASLVRTGLAARYPKPLRPMRAVATGGC